MENKTNNYEQNLDSFYRGQVFGSINEQFRRLEQKLDDQSIESTSAHQRFEDRLDKIDNKLWYMFGFAAAIGFGVSFAWEWIKTKL